MLCRIFTYLIFIANNKWKIHKCDQFLQMSTPKISAGNRHTVLCFVNYDEDCCFMIYSSLHPKISID